MITEENYFKTVEAIGLSKLPEELKSAHDFLIRASKNGTDWKRVNSSAALKEVKDLQFGHLEEISRNAKEAPKPEAKQVKMPETKKKDTPEKKATEGNLMVYAKAPGEKNFSAISLQEDGYKQHSNLMYATLIPFSKLSEAKEVINSYAESIPGTVFQIRKAGKNNQVLHEAKSASAEKKSPAPAEVKAKAPKAKKPKVAKAPVEDTSKKVGHYSIEQRLLRRFASYDGRKVSIKVMLLFIKALQKAMADLSLSKKSNNASLLSKIQDSALALYQTAVKEGKEFIEVKFESDWAKGLHQIAKAESVIPTIPLLKRYINLLGGKPSIEKVENLLKAIKSAFAGGRIKDNTLHKAELLDVKSALESYVAKRRTNLEVSRATLNGLEGLFGKKFETAARKPVRIGKKSSDVSREKRKQLLSYTLEPVHMPAAPRASSTLGNLPGMDYGMASTHFTGSAFGPSTYNGMAAVEETTEETTAPGQMPAHMRELFAERQRNIEPLRLSGDLGKFLGEFEQHEYAMVLRGDPGAGKSRFQYQLMNLFSSAGLAVANFTLEMSKDSKIAQDYKNLYIHPSNRARILHADQLPEGLETIKEAAEFVDVIFIDSWSKIGAKQEEFDKLRRKYKKVIWIVIFQSTTNGTSRGGVGAEYDGDAILQVHKGGIAVFEKNRYETPESRELAYKVFDQKAVPRDSVSVK